MLRCAVERETFSSEFRDVHERRPGDRDSFNDEFRGASDSLIEKDRPSMVGGRGRGAVVAMAVVLLLPLLIGGGIALWVWRVPIGSWLAGSEPETETEPVAKDPVVAAPIPDLPPAEPAVEKVFGIRGAPDENAALPIPEPVQPEPPVQPDPPAQPNSPVQPTPPGSKIEAVSTNVSGTVASTAVSLALDKLDPPLAACWANAGAPEPIELELSLTIARDGSMQTYSLGGGNEGLNACVLAALPSKGWPRPREGVATVTRKWKLG
jgi:hypothetical protein